jgi:hypothetical protein
MPRRGVTPNDGPPTGKRALGQWKAERKRDAERAYAAALSTGYAREAEIFRNAAEQLIEHDNPAFFDAIGRLKRIPVTIDEFMDSKEFLGCSTDEPLMDVWPGLRDPIFRMNPDVMIGEAPVKIALMGGATGWGKTHASLVTTAYQGYLATCFNNPHRMFKLNKATTPIMFMFMSVSGTVTKRVLYTPFRTVFTNMPYSKKWLNWDKTLESELRLEGNIMFVPALASLQSLVGQAIAGAVIDEINFMLVIENSKQVAGAFGQGGHFDQAEIIYSNITRRQKRSFTTAGVSFGTICAPSSTRYKGDYIDRKMAEAEEQQTPNVLPLRYKQYDIAPLKDPRDLAGETFSLLVGTDDYPTRVLEESAQAGLNYPEHGLIERVPISFKPYFLSDPEGAGRDVLGVASNSITPFFSQRHKIVECILAGREHGGLNSFIVKPDVILSSDGMPQIIEEELPLDRETPRFVHIDLSISGDRTGIAMVKYDGHTPIENPQTPGQYELLPKYVVEMAVSIKPDSLNHLDPADVRTWVMQLATYYNLNIAMVTYDSFQSKESQGLFRAAGIASQEISMDKTAEPYKTFRSAVYDGRVLLPESDLLRQEMISLEFIADKDKINHPPKGSKDLADAVCGAIYSCARNRHIRSQNVVVNRAGQRKKAPTSTERREPARAAGLRRK